MTFMWRLYIPITNRFRLVRIFISHWPVDGNRMGVDGVKRGRRDSTLTKWTTSRRVDRPSKGFLEYRLAMSRPWQTTISATNGSFRSTSARAWAWVIDCRMTSVPAAPILTAPRCSSASANLEGRKVLWPPTLIPLRKTTSANDSAGTSLYSRLPLNTYTTDSSTTTRRVAACGSRETFTQTTQGWRCRCICGMKGGILSTCRMARSNDQ